jgi:hypothetical protein
VIALCMFPHVGWVENITCNTHWTIQCSRMLKYSIISLTSLTSGGHTFGIVHSRTEATELYMIGISPINVNNCYNWWTWKANFWD